MPKYYFEYARIDDLKGDDTVYGPMDAGYNRRYLKSCDIVADSVEGAEEIFMKEHPECEILRQETYSESFVKGRDERGNTILINDDEPDVDDIIALQYSKKLTTCPVCGEEKFNDTIGLCVDCGYDENSWGSFEYIDTLDESCRLKESVKDIRTLKIEDYSRKHLANEIASALDCCSSIQLSYRSVVGNVNGYVKFNREGNNFVWVNQKDEPINKDTVNEKNSHNLSKTYVMKELLYTLDHNNCKTLIIAGCDEQLHEEKRDGRLSPTSYKYKGYRISLDHKIGAYSIFDKHGEMEDHGYLSKEAAEKFIDSLIDARQLKNKEESINEEIKVLRIRGKEYPIRDKSFLTDDKVASINNEYGLEHIFNVKTPDGKRYKIYDSGFGNLGHSDACAILAEDYTVGGYVHTSIEYKGEHIIPSKYKPGKYFVSINRVGETPQKKFFDSVDEAKIWIDSLNEALPALAVGAITAAATGFGQGLGDKLGSKIFGEELSDDGFDITDKEDLLTGLGADLGFDKEEQKYFLRKWKKYINK